MTQDVAKEDSSASGDVPAAGAEDASTPVTGMKSLYGQAALSGLVSLAVSVAVLAGYHVMTQGKSKPGMVDVASLLEINELIFTEKISKPGASEADKEQALEQVKHAAPKIEQAVLEIQQECNCLLLTKPAVVGDTAIDYTPRIRKALGFDSVDAAQLQARIRGHMRSKSGDEAGAPAGASASMPTGETLEAQQ